MQDQPTDRPADDPVGQVERELRAAQEEVRELGNILRAALAEDERLAQQEHQPERQPDRPEQQGERSQWQAERQGNQPDWRGEGAGRQGYRPATGGEG